MARERAAAFVSRRSPLAHVAMPGRRLPRNRRPPGARASPPIRDPFDVAVNERLPRYMSIHYGRFQSRRRRRAYRSRRALLAGPGLLGPLLSRAARRAAYSPGGKLA